MAVSPTLRPEYAYDPSAKPVSLKPAGSGAGSAFVSAVSRGADVAVWAARAAGASSHTVQRATLVMSFMARPPVHAGSGSGSRAPDPNETAAVPLRMTADATSGGSGEANPPISGRSTPTPSPPAANRGPPPPNARPLQ